jgi:hypothetical protein
MDRVPGKSLDLVPCESEHIVDYSLEWLMFMEK